MKHLQRVVITDACKKSKPWKQVVAGCAQKEFGKPLWDCPIYLNLVFCLPRPQSHFGSGKNSSRLRDGAKRRPTVKPDVLKLARAVEDALTGILYVDDALIVQERLEKIYESPAGVRIMLSEAGE